ncbi:MAG: excinuclease ABC subunit C, partial [bacterium]|nr:excinuclease ABC subunit C [bacterium]
ELEEFLSEQAKRKVFVKVPQKGRFKRLIEMVKENSAVNLYKKVVQEHKTGMIMLRDILELQTIPAVIECFDISNLGDSFAVASEVRFTDGYPDKKNYRHFRIKTVQHQDDFAMMKEVVNRRYTRLLKEGKKLPQIIMIDGGPGQLSSAVNVLNDLGLNGIMVISLAKKEEEIYLSKQKKPLKLKQDSPALLLLQRIRDEAHRFAVSYHKKLRDNYSLKSVFDEI